MVCKRVLFALAVVLATAAWLSPVALASVTPSLTLDQSAGTTAGSTVNLGVDIKFAADSKTPTDSPKHLVLALPPGLLANASINNGACIKSATPDSACQVGSGSVMAKPILPGNIVSPVAVPVPVTFDLVAPPSPSDLAGLAIISLGSQLGTTGGVLIDSTGRSGPGLDIAFTGVPDTYSIAGVQTNVVVTEIQSTFDSLRMPTSCPAPPAKVAVGSDSYSDSSTQSAQTSLQVTGCSGLPFSPAFQVTAAKDAGDSGVAITTDITQPAGQATSKTVALNLPASVLTPNVGAVLSGGILCTSPASDFSNCRSIGSASATSPLYPSTLSGQAYLTGSLTAPSIALVFPPPFALTLVGNVDLAHNSTTFNNVPDIPLSDLKVSLAGGLDAVFATTCTPPSGTASATLTSQNGDKTASPSSAFTVSGCGSAGSGSGSGGGGGKGTGGGGSGKNGSGAKSGRAKLSSGSAGGLTKGKPTLRFKVFVPRGSAKLTAIAIRLPGGLSFNRTRVHSHSVTGLTLNGNHVASSSIKRGALVVTLKRQVSTLNVFLSAKLLKETKGLKKKAGASRNRLKSLKVTVGTDDANGVTFAPSLVVKKLNLPKLKPKPKRHS